MMLYEFRVRGRLDQCWSTCFEGLKISYEGDDITVLRGSLIDEAALYGVLMKMRDLTLPLLAMRLVQEKKDEEQTAP